LEFESRCLSDHPGKIGNPKIGGRVILFANTDWYLYNFRLSLAQHLVAAGNEVLLLSPPGKYGEKLRALGFRWEPVSMDRRSLNVFAELGLVLRLAKLFRHEAPDLVHGFTIKCAVYGSLAGRLAGVSARVSAVAGLGYIFTNNDRRARILRGPVRLLLRLALGGAGARLIVQNGEDLRAFIDARIVSPRRAHLIEGSGVNCERFRPSKQSRPAGPLRVLLASRLLWDKGVAEFVQAARAVRLAGHDIDFLVAGNPDPGNPASIPLADVEQWVSEGVFRWLGHVDNMPKLFAEVDVVVLPSYREGLSKSLAEAAASGLALVTTDVPGCRDIVEDQVTGLLVPVRSAEALAKAFSTLDGDRKLTQRLGVQARQRAVARFAEQIIIERTLQVYDEAMKDRRIGNVGTETFA
jgi:glycosyltransferase involved in cell wall biosynthesis